MLRTKRTYQTFDWGEGLVELAYGEEGALKKTTYEYYLYPSIPFAADASRAPLKLVTHPEGSWEYYYSYDSEGRPTEVYSSFGNVISSSYTSGRLTTYTYGQLPSSPDDGDVSPDSPRVVSESLAGTTLSQRYTIYPSAYERLDIRCGNSLGTWDASDNLITTNLFYDSGTNEYRLKAVIHPDRTMQTYNYTNSPDGLYFTNISASGQPNSSYSCIVDGSSNRVVLNQFGYTVSSTSWDIVSGIKISQTLYTNFDSYGRPQTINYLDGTSEYVNYDCCGVESRIDRQGVQTYFGYDAIKRPTSSWRLGITNLNVLDAAGRTLQRIRIGTNGSQIIQAQYKYNSANELLTETNALSGVTSHTESTDSGTGEVTHTTTYPDNGTRVEVHYRDGSVKKITGTAVNPVRYEYGVETEGSYQRFYTKEIKLNLNGTDSSEWTKSYTDTFGRAYKTVYAAASGAPASTSYYNNLGQLWKQTDPDGVRTLLGYNAKGERAYSAIDSNRNDLVDFGGSDRITETTNWVDTLASVDTRIQQIFVWSTDGSPTATLLSRRQSAVTGLKSVGLTYNGGDTLTNQSSTLYVPSSQLTVVTNMAPDSSYTVTTNKEGRKISVTQYSASGTQLGRLSFGYDAHGRQNVVTDARTGSSTNWFNNADQVSSTKTPVPATGQSAQVTTNLFDNMGRVWKTTLPDSTSVTNKYDVTGLLTNTVGSRTYPVSYTYDFAGRMKTMTTWQNFANNSGAATTTWNYDQYRGWLDNKRYDDSTGPNYTYTPAGRLETRTWARSVSGSPLLTTYSYNDAGDLNGVDYSDTTPDVTYGYDRRGRQTSVAQSGSTTTALKYDTLGNLLSECYSGGPLNGLIISNRFDSLARRTNGSLLNSPSTVLSSTAYGYDDASRLKTVADGNNTVAYSYLANSPLVTNVWFTNGTTLRMTTTKSYDLLNRLTGISSAAGGSNVAVFNYAYNSANQRTTITNVDNSRWVYQYDSLGQVVSGKKYWADGTPVAGQQFEYGFDDIGNRKTTGAGGDTAGANLRYASYTNNTLNQITSRSVPGYLNVLGTAKTNVTVTLWGDNGAFSTTSRKSDYFRGELAATNSSTALWLSITNLAVLNDGSNPDIVTNTIGKAFLPKNAEGFGYDLDGNLTNDGRWSYTWDAENRLVQQESLTGAPTASKFKLEFAYDARGRRLQKLVSTNNGSAYGPQYTNRFAYDGWNLLGVLAPNASLLSAYTWGIDLSGSMQGAGGVGGLLVSRDTTVVLTNYATYDGNGNVASLVNAASGAVSASYEYGPFGEVIRTTGTTAKANPFRFSTKYQDDESDYLYYGYRSYNPSSGRWVTRDLIGETGFGTIRGLRRRMIFDGNNLFSFLRNNPISSVDSVGLHGYGNPPSGPNGPVPPSNPFNVAMLCAGAQAQVATLSAKMSIDVMSGNGVDPNDEAALIGAIAMMDSFCGPPPRPPQPPRCPPGPLPPPWPAPAINPEDVEKTCFWTTVGVVTYWVCSESSRIIFPPRNLIPVP